MTLPVAHLLTNCFQRVGKYVVLLHAPCSVEAHIKRHRDYDLGIVRINTLHLGENGIPVGYAIEATGRVKMGPFHLLAARRSFASQPIKELERIPDYPELRFKLPGLKVLTTSTSITVLCSQPTAITEHLNNP